MPWKEVLDFDTFAQAWFNSAEMLRGEYSPGISGSQACQCEVRSKLTVLLAQNHCHGLSAACGMGAADIRR